SPLAVCRPWSAPYQEALPYSVLPHPPSCRVGAKALVCSGKRKNAVETKRKNRMESDIMITQMALQDWSLNLNRLNGKIGLIKESAFLANRPRRATPVLARPLNARHSHQSSKLR